MTQGTHSSFFLTETQYPRPCSASDGPSVTALHSSLPETVRRSFTCSSRCSPLTESKEISNQGLTKELGKFLNPCSNPSPGQLAHKSPLRIQLFKGKNGLAHRCQQEAKEGIFKSRTVYAYFSGGRMLGRV